MSLSNSEQCTVKYPNEMQEETSAVRTVPAAGSAVCVRGRYALSELDKAAIQAQPAPVGQARSGALPALRTLSNRSTAPVFSSSPAAAARRKFLQQTPASASRETTDSVCPHRQRAAYCDTR